MALAILELLTFDGANVRFRIDTGTNKYYQLRVGKSVRHSNGIDWVDEIFLKTRIAANEAGGSLLNSSREIAIPATRLGAGHAYVQLFSFKTPEGKSPAFSNVINVPVGSSGSYGTPEYMGPMSIATAMNTVESFRSPRVAPCRTCREVYSQPASIDDLLSGIIKIASPIVMNLLGSASGAKTNGASKDGGDTGQAETIVKLLTTLLGSLGGAPTANTSKPQSLLSSGPPVNRFFATQSSTFARPFIFGIDDALLGALAGQVVQVLPQLMTAANQRRIDLKKTDDKLVSDILSDINRRLLMDQLLDAQRQQQQAAGQPDNSAAIQQVIQLLQQAGTAPAGTVTTPTKPQTTATTKSLSLSVPDNAVLSSKAVVEFVTGDAVTWNGEQKILFARSHDLQLKVQLKTAEPPKAPMPKAIIKITLQDAADEAVRYEKIFKQKDVSANTPLSFPFAQGELAHLPVNKPISLLAEMRWRTKSGAEYKALGSSEFVMVNNYFYKEQGGEAGAEQELTDMKRFRPFWNKVWDSPALDVSRGGEKKYLWELNVNAKYTVLLTADQETNGLMQTKLLRGKQDPDSLSETVEGRMKAGIELSLAELNKLLPLWNGEAVLDREKLEALKSGDFVKNNSGEFHYNFKLKGRAAERGMIWVIPVFKLFECVLGNAAKIDDTGQVTAMSEEKVHFPLPVSARVIGLKSQT